MTNNDKKYLTLKEQKNLDSLKLLIIDGCADPEGVKRDICNLEAKAEKARLYETDPASYSIIYGP